MNQPNASPSASESARVLAGILQREADHLDSDDLETISEAMTRVRTGARALAESLLARGWGGGVLYGFGEPGKWDRMAADAIEVQQLVDAGELDRAEMAEAAAAQVPVPAGRRVSYQARIDFIVTDEVALRAYVRRRLDEQEGICRDDDLVVANPVSMLTMLDGLEAQDYSDVGLSLAGGQSRVVTISRSLWEIDDDEQSDAFPTSAS